MKTASRIFLLGLLVSSLPGCVAKPEIPRKAYPYEKLHLWMKEDDTAKLLGVAGDHVAEDQLPMNPKPSVANPRLPNGIQWRVWSDGNPVVILGLRDGQVGFIHTELKQGQTTTYQTEVSQDWQ